MKKFISEPRIAFALSLMIVIAFSYVIVLDFLGDPRFTDYKLTIDEVYWWEICLFMAGIVSIFTLWLSALHLHGIKAETNGC